MAGRPAVATHEAVAGGETSLAGTHYQPSAGIVARVFQALRELDTTPASERYSQTEVNREGIRVQMLIGGDWLDGRDRSEVRDPQDGSLVDTVPRASGADLATALAAAAEGARIAATLPVYRRMEILHGAADRIREDADDVARTLSREGVKTIREARREVARCVDTLRLSAEEARRLHGETLRFDQQPAGEGRFGYWTREPVGVVAAITPFNDPLNLVAHKLGPALAAGNAALLKPDSKTPLSGIALVRALHDAGAPAGTVQVVTGSGSELGPELVADPRVRMVSFTGGAEVGEQIVRNAGIKRVSLELGSNCPVLVLEDADLDAAVPACVSGAYWAAGQNCLHVQRILVHESLYDEFRERFVAAAEALTVGDKQDEGTDMGPLISETAAARVERMVREATQAGARLLTGGDREGLFFSPTVLDRVPAGCALAREEVYGPVTVLQHFETLAEALEIANDVEYGLQAGVFTASLDRARRAVDGLRVGGVMVNESTDFRIDAMPFGGTKRSGLGREGVRFAVEEMTEPKLVCFTTAPGRERPEL